MEQVQIDHSSTKLMFQTFMFLHFSFCSFLMFLPKTNVTDNNLVKKEWERSVKRGERFFPYNWKKMVENVESKNFHFPRTFFRSETFL